MGRWESSRVPNILSLQHRAKVEPRSRHPRTNRADRTLADSRGFVVRQTDDLGENEGFTAIGVEMLDQISHHEITADFFLVLRAMTRGFSLDAASALASSNFVETHVSRDSKDPTANLVIRGDPVEASDNSNQHFLGQVIGRARINHVSTRPPHVCLHEAKKAFESDTVSVPRTKGGFREQVHGSHANDFYGNQDKLVDDFYVWTPTSRVSRFMR